MISDKSYLFILGAGTSIPYGFPSGPTLVNNILNHLGNRNDLPKKDNISAFKFELLTSGFDKKEVDEFENALKRSGRKSIDSFLEHRKDLTEIGKVVIALEISMYESKSNILHSDRSQSLYHYLFEKMNTSLEEFSNNNIAFITFNYDRSLEHFLFESLKHSYNLSNKDVCQILENVPIKHVHGQAGLLPWQVTSDEENQFKKSFELTIDFSRSQSLKRLNLKKISQLIHTIHDNPSKSQLDQGIASLIMEANEIIFLGFGYHPDNLKRLGLLNERFMKETRVGYLNGTAFGLTDLERRNVTELLRKSGKNVKLDSNNFKNLEYLRNKIELK